MKHYGDITQIHGDQVEPVDVITGGSPCQDLSVAGKRAGLAGERSGLFMDQIRIVKEMRQADVLRGRSGQFIRPRYMVWENVPGAFSSGKPKGADFAAVIEEIIKVCEEGASVSVCVPDGGWTKSGCYYAEDGSWSIAWRVHDAQFWGASQYVDGRMLVRGTPQRRKRIALVADFGGLSAPEILFERKGLHWDPEPSGEAGEGTAGAAGGGIKVAELTPNAEQTSAVYDARGNGDGVTVPTITGDHQNRVTDYTAVVLPFDTTQITSPVNRSNPNYGDPCHPLAAGAHAPAVAIGNGQLNQISMAEQANNLDTMHDQQAVLTYAPDVAHSLRAKANCQFREDAETYVAAVDCRNGRENPEINGTLQAKSNGGISYNLQNVCRTGATVRRLTPMECERLQGFPDNWTDIGEWTDTKGKKHKPADSPRYKALGNSIALPFWKYLARRICAQYERQITMASLFDGIGGFPLAFQAAGAVPVWASEIEEFPIAVTKRHFPEEVISDGQNREDPAGSGL